MDQATVAIRVGSVPDAFALKGWLDDVPALRGRGAVMTGRPLPGRQGGVSDTLVVALGSGGAASVLVASLTSWIKTRGRPKTLKLSVERGKKKIEIEMEQTTDSAAIVAAILRVFEGDGDGSQT
jgi:hypothetical protein